MIQPHGVSHELVSWFILEISVQWTLRHSQGYYIVTMKVLVLELEQHLKSSSGASVVAIDNKIEQAMDLVKSHLMYAVREEVEVLKEQIKELIEKNSQLEQENSLLKTLASPEQLAQFQAQLQNGSPPSSSSSQPVTGTPAPTQPATQSSGPSA
ncbi:PREDICTED: TSC22 domain family protein 1 isoform X2 [Nanorana parkeri]|uniref:TSC22 domain family protein 1 isoform X2 n=1 Tax=Nanorana parkeri TaxID=125878 RepID=UPI00085494E3|nr:PREDICTED: TSC22 domain family protein 1 isoform X2 [Nanorana parkeri]